MLVQMELKDNFYFIAKFFENNMHFPLKTLWIPDYGIAFIISIRFAAD